MLTCGRSVPCSIASLVGMWWRKCMTCYRVYLIAQSSSRPSEPGGLALASIAIVASLRLMMPIGAAGVSQCEVIRNAMRSGSVGQR